MDYIFAGEPKKLESVKIETPMGSIESDSGSHMIDIITVVGIIAVLFIGKHFFTKYLKK
mgnify:FL=1